MDCRYICGRSSSSPRRALQRGSGSAGNVSGDVRPRDAPWSTRAANVEENCVSGDAHRRDVRPLKTSIPESLSRNPQRGSHNRGIVSTSVSIASHKENSVRRLMPSTAGTGANSGRSKADPLSEGLRRALKRVGGRSVSLVSLVSLVNFPVARWAFRNVRCLPQWGWRPVGLALRWRGHCQGS